MSDVDFYAVSLFFFLSIAIRHLAFLKVCLHSIA